MIKDKIYTQNIKFYDYEATSYDKKRYETISGRRVDAFHKSILDKSFHSENKILDLGCGTGRLLYHFHNKDKDLYGIDFSENMLSFAKKRFTNLTNKPNLIHGSILDLPYKDNFFDGVYSILVLNLVPDFNLAIREVSRVLKPGGLFLFNVPNLLSIFFLGGIYVNIRGKTTTSNKTGARFSRWFKPKDWQMPLSSYGFNVENIYYQPTFLKYFDSSKPLNNNFFGKLCSKSIYIQARKFL